MTGLALTVPNYIFRTYGKPRKALSELCTSSIQWVAMQTALHHLSTGIHGSVYAYRKPATTTEKQNEERESVDLSAHGPSGWAVVKVVRAGPSGKTRDLKPHNVLREVLVLQKVKHPNVSLPPRPGAGSGRL
jgi:hypothetical protein